MVAHPPVLIAPDTLRRRAARARRRGGDRARAGARRRDAVPELCPLSGGGAGTIEALLPALGGETGDGFALVEDGGTAIVELAGAPS